MNSVLDLMDNITVLHAVYTFAGFFFLQYISMKKLINYLK